MRGAFRRIFLLSAAVLVVTVPFVEPYLIPIVVVITALIVWQTAAVRRSVEEITGFSRSLAQGDISGRLVLDGAAEFDELVRNLNAMSGELKKIIERKEEETDRLNMILKSIPDALLIINTDGAVELSNDAAEGLFGDSPRGKHFIEVVRDPVFFTLVDEVRRSLTPGLRELRVDHPEERCLTVRVSPLFYRKDELSGFVAIFHDMTQLKRLEQMRKDFVANVSHEIKTPVTAIKGFAETLSDGAIDDRDAALRFLDAIRSHSERLNRLVEDLMTLSRIELGAIKIDRTEVDVAEIIDSVIETLKGRAASKGLYLRRSLKAGRVRITADRDRTVQILLNLVDNAIKFTESGGVEIGMDRDDGGDCIFVRDTGIGIPRKYLSRLGERFFRVDPSRSRELGGTGLGLAIVKHLVRAHGWGMRIESEEGKGTVVKILLA